MKNAKLAAAGSALALCTVCLAEPEATAMSFVGTATGTGKLADGTTWGYTGTASVALGKKSGGGSTGGGFVSRSDPSWQAHSLGQFSFELQPDGVYFYTNLEISGHLPAEFIQTWSLQASVTASFTFTTDAPMFIADAQSSNCGGYCSPFFQFQSPTWYDSVGMLFPGTHRIDLEARSIGSNGYDRDFYRSSPGSRKISLKPMPDGFATPAGALHREFSSGNLLLARDGAGAFLNMPLYYPYSVNLLWSPDATPRQAGFWSDTPYGLVRSGSMVIAKSSPGKIVRWTEAGGRQEIDWPNPNYGMIYSLEVGASMASADGDTIVALKWDGPVVSTVLWNAATGFSDVPMYPGANYMSPSGISPDGSTVWGYWSNSDAGQYGWFVWNRDSGFITLPVDFEPLNVTEGATLVLGRDSQTYRPKYVEGGVLKDLELPPDRYGRALGASADGSVIVAMATDGMGGDETVLWLDRTRRLRLSDFLKEHRVAVDPNLKLQFRDISADGQTIAFVESGYDFEIHNWVTRPLVYRIAAVCASDFNLDRQVDDSDFVIFLKAYNDLLCPAEGNCWTDLNSDGVTDDEDFSLFVVAYDALLCE